MKIFVNAKTEDICKNICATLEELSTEIVYCSDDAEQGKDLSDYDAIVVSTPLRSEFGLEFVTDAAKRSNAAIVVLSRADIAEDVQNRIKFTGAFVIGKPFPKSVLVNTVKMAVLAKENMNRLEKEKSDLSKQLDDVKIIDRAKCYLIEYLNLTESQAHRHIQKLAMDTRRTQREIAEDVLRTYSGMTNV
ncbi:MAG: ANTAR domain-containing protein [Oscillospiraceae bacterium]|nr:ANTAR domain-containing protein [Oscillospiraceae bacterium]